MDFYEKFCSFSNAHLLNIIENPDDYQPNAVLTAQKILESRNLSQEEIDATLQENEEKRAALENEKRRKKEQIQSIGNQMSDFINRFKPYSHSELTPNKTNKYLVVVLISYVLFQLYQISTLFIRMFRYSLLDHISILFALPTLYLCVCIFLLYRQNKYGWHLIIFFGVYQIVTCLYLFLSFMFFYSGIVQFSQPEAFTSLFIWSGLLYTLNTKSLINLYKLSRTERWSSISISLIIGCFILLLSYGYFSF